MTLSVAFSSLSIIFRHRISFSFGLYPHRSRSLRCSTARTRDTTVPMTLALLSTCAPAKTRSESGKNAQKDFDGTPRSKFATGRGKQSARRATRGEARRKGGVEEEVGGEVGGEVEEEEVEGEAEGKRLIMKSRGISTGG